MKESLYGKKSEKNLFVMQAGEKKINAQPRNMKFWIGFFQQASVVTLRAVQSGYK